MAGAPFGLFQIAKATSPPTITMATITPAERVALPLAPAALFCVSCDKDSGSCVLLEDRLRGTVVVVSVVDEVVIEIVVEVCDVDV